MVTEIATVEKIYLSDKDIEKELENFFEERPMDEETMAQLKNDPQMRESIATQIFSDRTVDRIIAIAKGENPEIVEFVEENDEEVTDESEAVVEVVAENVKTEEPDAEAVEEEIEPTDETDEDETEV